MALTFTGNANAKPELKAANAKPELKATIAEVVDPAAANAKPELKATIAEVVDLAEVVDPAAAEPTAAELCNKPEETLATVDDSFVDSLFESGDGDEDKAISWQCIGHACDVVMTSLEDCYPVNQRGDSGAMLRCLNCWNKDKKIIEDAQKNATNYRNINKAQLANAKMQGMPKEKNKSGNSNKKQGDEGKGSADKGKAGGKGKGGKGKGGKGKGGKGKAGKGKGGKGKAGKGKVPKEKKPEKPFEVGENVLGLWQGAGWFRAQIFATSSGKYDLYFPEDGEEYLGAPKKHLKRPKKKENWTKLKREDYLDIVFTHTDVYRNTPTEKKGKFKALRVGKGPHTNRYICEYVTGRKTITDNTEYPFDIGYVQKKLFTYFFPLT